MKNKVMTGATEEAGGVSVFRVVGQSEPVTSGQRYKRGEGVAMRISG